MCVFCRVRGSVHAACMVFRGMWCVNVCGLHVRRKGRCAVLSGAHRSESGLPASGAERGQSARPGAAGKGRKFRMRNGGATKLLPAPRAARRNAGLVCGSSERRDWEITLPSAEDFCVTWDPGSNLTLDVSQA